MPVDSLVGRLRPFGTSVFAEMTALAQRTGAVNLGQGFPDSDGPPALLAAAQTAVRQGFNQYPPVNGLPALRETISRQRFLEYGTSYDVDSEIVVTAGATEAMTATVLGLCEPGDEVVLFEPYYDSYAAAIAMAGASRKVVTLRPRAGGFTFDPDELRAAVCSRTRLLVLNSPHNPTGKVFDRGELDLIARLCRERDLVAVTDEVYEYLVYDGRSHLPLSALPGMRERTLTISSAGKTLNVTGWKVGWACGPANLVAAVRTAKQHLSFANGTPFQQAVGTCLLDSIPWIEANRASMQHRRDLLRAHLSAGDIEAGTAEGGYFLQFDARSLGYPDGATCCQRLPEDAGVAALPLSAFYDNKDTGANLVRLAFCKNEATLLTAAEKLTAWAHSRTGR